jgi:hypothetical protein
MRLTARDRERGMSLFACPKHGALVVTLDGASVRCECGKEALRTAARGRVDDAPLRRARR